MTSSARLFRALLTLVLLSGAGLVLGAAPAAATVTRLCTGYTTCAQAGMSASGYAAAAGTMWWRMYSGHNCTNYAAYRMVQSGLPNERPWSGSGNATNWGAAMRGITDGTPAVGAVAWWSAYVYPAGSAGHVAYVEKVISDDEIIVSQDSWGGDFSWARITRDSKGWPSGFIHFNDVPMTNTSRPKVTGTARVGSVLTASPGVWEPSDVDVVYQWRSGGVDIPGAQAPTLTLTKALEGRRVRVRVTASRLGYPTTWATSRRTSPIESGVLESTAAPTVLGEAKVDSTLTVDAGGWEPSPDAVSYQWLADGAPIAGATGTELTVVPTLLGKNVSVRATATKQGYQPVEVTSQRTASVTKADLTVPDQPVVTGAAAPGGRLAVTVPTSAPQTTPTVRWWRDGAPVRGATGPTYDVTDLDLGARITAHLRYVREGYRILRTQSVPTPRVRTTPTVRIGTESSGGRLEVRAAVRASGVSPVEGVVRIRSQGELLGEVTLVDGRAATTLTGLPAGARGFRFRFPGNDKVTGGEVRRVVRIE